MKILLANKFYYRRGGDCIYMLNLEQLLKAHGHEVAVFAMEFPQNEKTPWQRYFPSNMSKLKAFTRPFGDGETKKKFKQLLEDFKPDVVHLNNIHTQLSPVIAEIAHKKGIRVVWSLHDYKLLCPRYDCMRNGQNCELCFSHADSADYTDKDLSRIGELENANKSATSVRSACNESKQKWNCVKYSCMKGGKIGSLIGYKEAVRWNRERLENDTDVFVCPSQFMADKMAQGGFDRKKLVILCNFIDIEKCKRTDDYQKGDYYCYVGRLSHEKGVKTLIEAANQLPYHLVVIGGGPLMDELKTIAHDNIEFVGFKQWDDIKKLVGGARFSVIPSECYENNPLSVIEAECLGTPVLGARIGGIPELIEEGKSGMTFTSKDVNDLKVKIHQMWDVTFDYQQLAEESMKRYNAEEYYKNIMKVYQG
jgi:glycosyltransferase involved in cell wall biosynthesis